MLAPLGVFLVDNGHLLKLSPTEVFHVAFGQRHPVYCSVVYNHELSIEAHTDINFYVVNTCGNGVFKRLKRILRRCRMITAMSNNNEL